MRTFQPETLENFETGTKFLDGCVDLFEKQQLTKSQAEKVIFEKLNFTHLLIQLIESYKNMFPGVKHALEVVKVWLLMICI